MKHKKLGIIQLPLVIGMLVLTVALGLSARLVQNPQDTRNRAFEEELVPTVSDVISSPTPTCNPNSCSEYFGCSFNNCGGSGMGQYTCHCPSIPTDSPNWTTNANVNCGNCATPTPTSVIPTNTPTNTPTLMPTNTPTNTPTPTLIPTNTPTNIPTNTPTSTPTNTPTPRPMYSKRSCDTAEGKWTCVQDIYGIFEDKIACEMSDGCGEIKRFRRSDCNRTTGKYTCIEDKVNGNLLYSQCIESDENCFITYSKVTCNTNTGLWNCKADPNGTMKADECANSEGCDIVPTATPMPVTVPGIIFKRETIDVAIGKDTLPVLLVRYDNGGLSRRIFGGYQIIKCTKSDCSTYTTVDLINDKHYWMGADPQLYLDNNDLPVIVYVNKMLKCKNKDCTEKNDWLSFSKLSGADDLTSSNFSKRAGYGFNSVDSRLFKAFIDNQDKLSVVYDFCTSWSNLEKKECLSRELRLFRCKTSNCLELESNYFEVVDADFTGYPTSFDFKVSQKGVDYIVYKGRYDWAYLIEGKNKRSIATRLLSPHVQLFFDADAYPIVFYNKMEAYDFGGGNKGESGVLKVRYWLSSQNSYVDRIIADSKYQVNNVYPYVYNFGVALDSGSKPVVITGGYNGGPVVVSCGSADWKTGCFSSAVSSSKNTFAGNNFSNYKYRVRKMVLDKNDYPFVIFEKDSKLFKVDETRVFDTYRCSDKKCLSTTINRLMGDEDSLKINYYQNPNTCFPFFKTSLGSDNYSIESVKLIDKSIFTSYSHQWSEVNLMKKWYGNNFGQMEESSVAGFSQVKGDLNGDGKINLVRAGNSGVRILFSTWKEYQMGGSYLDIADVNKDNKLDIFGVDDGKKQIDLLVNLGGEAFEIREGVIKLEKNVSGFRVVDMDNDGLADVIVSLTRDNKVLIYKNKGNYVFEKVSELVVGKWPGPIEIIDYNDDGKMDLVIGNMASDNLFIMRNNGNFSFSKEDELKVGYLPMNIINGDFDNDGKDDDLAVSSTAASMLTVFYKNSGVFEKQFELNINRAWALESGDLDNDSVTNNDLMVGSGGSLILFKNNKCMLTPTITPYVTGTPVMSKCTICTNGKGNKTIGDADCDGVATVYDREIWRKEFMEAADANGVAIIKNNWQSDYNCDGKVDVVDRDIWKDNYLKTNK